MTPGVFAGLLADELDLDVGTVAVIQRNLRELGGIRSHGRGRAASHVDIHEAVRVLVAVCAHLTGETVLAAGNIASRADESWLRKLTENIRLGQVFVYGRETGDRHTSITLSSRAIKAIRDAAGFSKMVPVRGILTANEARAASGLDPIHPVQ